MCGEVIETICLKDAVVDVLLKDDRIGLWIANGDGEGYAWFDVDDARLVWNALEDALIELGDNPTR